mmetsp:Transcript_12432/g.30992  ORF Transcript_12432/g.30992 Transcript_12432/m.30992 type:complete len:272 (+) Transcript_12432:247-1062(+)
MSGDARPPVPTGRPEEAGPSQQPTHSHSFAGDAPEWTAPPRGVEAPPTPPSLLPPVHTPPLGVEAPPPLTPRMRAVYERTSVRPRGGINSIHDAISMRSDALGRKTEAIRRMALRAAIACDAHAPLSLLSADAPTAQAMTTLAIPSPANAIPTPAAVAHASPAGLSAGCQHAAFSATVVPSHDGQHATSHSSAPRDVEGERIAVEVRRLLSCVPDSMLMYGRPISLPPNVRRDNLIDTISKYDAGTIAKGRALDCFPTLWFPCVGNSVLQL